MLLESALVHYNYSCSVPKFTSFLLPLKLASKNKMKLRKTLSARKASWLAFGLIALAGVSSAYGEPPQDTTSELSDVSGTLLVSSLRGDLTSL